MGVHDITISVAELIEKVGSPAAPRLIDVRRRAVFEEADRVIAGAKWRDHRTAETWASELQEATETVVYCVHGHNVSHCAAAALRNAGNRVRLLDGGIEAWIEAGGATLLRDKLPAATLDKGSRWLTGSTPTAERLLGTWLIRRWIDPDATILCLDEEWVEPTAEDLSALAFAVEGFGPSNAFELAAQFGLEIEGLDRLRGPGLDGAVELARRNLADAEHGLAVLDALFAADRWRRAA